MNSLISEAPSPSLSMCFKMSAKLESAELSADWTDDEAEYVRDPAHECWSMSVGLLPRLLACSQLSAV